MSKILNPHLSRFTGKLLLFLIFSTLIQMIGCSNQNILQMKTENESLKAKVTVLEKEREELKKEVTRLQKEISYFNSQAGAKPEGYSKTPTFIKLKNDFRISYSSEQSKALNTFLGRNGNYSIVSNDEGHIWRQRLRKDKNFKDLPLIACWGDFTGDGIPDFAVIVKKQNAEGSNPGSGHYSVLVFHGNSKGGYDEPIVLYKDGACDFIIFLPPDASFGKPLLHVQQVACSGSWEEFYWDKAARKYRLRVRTDKD